MNCGATFPNIQGNYLLTSPTSYFPFPEISITKMILYSLEPTFSISESITRSDPSSLRRQLIPSCFTFTPNAKRPSNIQNRFLPHPPLQARFIPISYIKHRSGESDSGTRFRRIERSTYPHPNDPSKRISAMGTSRKHAMQRCQGQGQDHGTSQVPLGCLPTRVTASGDRGFHVSETDIRRDEI
jgi:hypothetical protein